VASQKSFRRKDGSDDGDGANVHGTPRRDDTHQSTVGVSRSSVNREAVQAGAEQLKSLREKRRDTIAILALPFLASLSGT
jgi:hypothetical protein